MSYKPSAFYYRKAIREANTLKEAQDAGCLVVLELEQLKEWVRERGLIPPKMHITREEAEDKGWDCCS
jgi:hypothetical protein